MTELSVPLGAGVGFALGLAHALDADHVLAVSTLAGRRAGWRQSVGHGLRWGLGHGFALLVLAAIVLAMGRSLPEAFSRVAERLVGVVLVGLGVWVLWDLRRRRVHLHFHEHDGLPSHAHWHTHSRADPDHHRHPHGAVLVGVLHGAAGSAPILALLPLSKAVSWGGALLYLASFSLGVLTAMLVFSGLLGIGLGRLRARSDAWTAVARAGVAFLSIAAGSYWILAA